MTERKSVNVINDRHQDEKRNEIIEQIKKLSIEGFSKGNETRIRQFLINNADIFATDPKKHGLNNKVIHEINTQGNKPFKIRPYRISPKEEEIIRKEVKEMLTNGIIWTSRSPWGSPVVLVTKKDGSIRFCVDYRKLNSITKKDVYPLPRIDDTLDRIGGKQIYSGLDLASGYWQIAIKEEDKEKTAFISCAGLYEFNIMSFGLCNTPSTFQRMMDEVLEGIDKNVGRDYIDDIIIGSKNVDEHLKDLDKLFWRLREYSLKVKLNKYHFFKRKSCILDMKYQNKE